LLFGPLTQLFEESFGQRTVVVLPVPDHRERPSRLIPCQGTIDQVLAPIGATRYVGEERDALFEGNQGLNGRDLGTPAGYLRLTLVRAAEVKHLLAQAVHLVEQNEAFAS
jgi:hypothetical protein